MKTEDLKAQGLTQEQIDYVFEEHGKEVNKLKKDNENLSGQLSDVKEELAKFDGVNVDELQGKIKELETTVDTNKKEYEKEIANRDFNDLLASKAKSLGARDVKAVAPFLDVDKLKESKNQDKDIEEALKSVKKENAYLFETDDTTPPPRAVSSTPGSGNDTHDDKKDQANQAIRDLLKSE